MSRQQVQQGKRGTQVTATRFSAQGEPKCGIIGAIVLAAATWGCRGKPSDAPPVHLNFNMDYQSHFKPQEANEFFEDNRAMRPLVPGTVARGQLRDNEHFYEGKINGQYANTLPMPLTMELLQRGQERFNINCTPCHGRAGLGDGMVVKRGFTPAPNFHDDRLLSMPVGQIVEVIANGVRTMPPYAHSIQPADRWAIAAYVRALQMGRRASLDQVPADVAASKGWR